VAEVLCDLSDFPVSQCGCRIHKPEADKASQTRPARAYLPGPAFPARYGGKCDVCGEGFHEGDLIRALAGSFVHDGCEGDA
jgi:hypothetical protein